MMNFNKINNQIPANTAIGVRQISKQIDNLSLSREAMGYLAAIQGNLQITISGETGKTSHRVVDTRSDFLCTTRELEALAGYKSFINSKKDEIANENLRDTGIMILHHLKAQFELLNTAVLCPDRMLEANVSKFGQLKKNLEVLLKNMEVIDSLPNGEEKTYLLTKGHVLKRIILKSLVLCVGPTKLEQDTIVEMLMNCCIPQFLYSKFTDPNFTKDAKNDAAPLIFPRGNFMKSISLTTAEINSNAMLRANEVAIRNSHSIIELARSANLKAWFIPRGNEQTDDLDDQWVKFVWPMMANGDYNAYLKPRVDRVNTKSFTPTLAPRAKPGDKKNFRPETVFQREVRELKNHHGKFLGTLLEFYHFIPKVDSPLDDFWTQVFPDSGNWVISPEMTIYHWIENDANCETVLNAIKDNSMTLIKRKMCRIVCLNLDIPDMATRSHALTQILMTTGTNTAAVIYDDDPPVGAFVNALPIFEYTDLTDVSSVTGHIRDAVNIFRGKTTEELQKGTKTKALIGKTKLAKQAAKDIKKITDVVMRDAIKKWITENFRNKKMQNLAAEYVTTAIEEEGFGYDSSEDEESSDDEDA